MKEQAEVMFEDIWDSLVTEIGEEKMTFPKEIMWLGGAPGAGKGTNTGFIMRERGYTAAPLVVSSLLTTPKMQAIKAAGNLVGDKEVIEVLFHQLLDPSYTTGVVIDGFPRTKVQALVVHKLFDKMMHLRHVHEESSLAAKFCRPIFRICVLFVEEEESVARQLGRGEKTKLHNDKVKATGKGTLEDIRPTDFDPELAAKRYTAFEESTYEALEYLGKYFIYNFVNAQGSYAAVENNIIKEMEYQSSQELNPETHDCVRMLPRVDEIIVHARQKLVKRLDTYVREAPDDFKDVVAQLEKDCYPHIEVNAIAGKCFYEPESLNDQQVAMALDILSDRGFRANSYPTSEGVAIAVDWDAPKIRR